MTSPTEIFDKIFSEYQALERIVDYSVIHLTPDFLRTAFMVLSTCELHGYDMELIK